VEFYGAEPLKRYYATQSGAISEDLQALLTRQAREKAELVHNELTAQAQREQRNATYFADLTSQIYQHERDDSFEDANHALMKVVTFYQKTETDRLDILAKKERERQPSTSAEWTNLVCQPIILPTRPDRSNSRGRKRQRKGSSGKRGQTAPNRPPTPTNPSLNTNQNPTPSNSYTGQGTNNGTSVTPSNSRGNLNANRPHTQNAQVQRPLPQTWTGKPS